MRVTEYKISPAYQRSDVRNAAFVRLIDKEGNDDATPHARSRPRRRSRSRQRRDAQTWADIANEDEIGQLFYWFNVVGRYARFGEVTLLCSLWAYTYSLHSAYVHERGPQ